MRILILYCLFLISNFSLSQLSIDSLKIELSNSKNDSISTFILRDISWEYISKDLDSALYFSNKCLEYAENSKNQFCLSKAYYQLGVIHYYRSELNIATENMISALKCAEKDSRIETVDILNVTAAIYIASGEPEKAFEIYHKQKAELIQKKDSVNLKTVISNLGSTYYSLGEYDSCIYYMKLLQNFEGINKSTIWHKIASSYEGKNDYENALFYSNKVLNSELSDRDYLFNLKLKARILNNTEKFEEAIEANRKVAEISKKLKDIDFLSKAYKGIYYNYEGLRQFDSAFYYYKDYVQLVDSMSEMKNIATIEEINAKYQSEKKELEIANQKAELKQHELLEYGLFGGVGMLLVLGGVIFSKYKDKNKANQLLIIKNEEIELKSNEILESIHYAKRLQSAILPPDKLVEKYLEESFILYYPKDIVSGDFYWMNNLDDNKLLFAAVDCTGHGVPGAFVSIVGYNLLNKMVDDLKITQPAEILTNLNKYMSEALSQEGVANIKDGMDISLCLLDRENMKLQFSGANNPVYIIRNGELIELKGNKIAIGSYFYREEKYFEGQEIDLIEGDSIYSFTDGYIDQFGGPKGKKFMTRQFKELLVANSSLPLKKQKEILIDNFEQWKGDLEQVDDICIIGVRV